MSPPTTTMDADRVRLNTLLDAVRDLAAARDMFETADIVLRAAREITGADAVTFLVRDGSDYQYFDEDGVAPLWKGQRFPITECLAGWVMEHGECLLVPDVSADPRVPRSPDAATFVRSAAVVPVGSKERIAAIGAYWATPHLPSGDELHIFERLADTAGVTLYNLRLYERLRDSEARFRLMADTSPVIIWVTDAQGHNEFVNRAYCEFFGVTEADVRGPNWQPLHPDDAGVYVAKFLRALREGTSFTAEARVRRADGEWRHIASYGAPRVSSDGRLLGCVGSSPDITDLKRALADAREAVRAKDDFVATLSHELRQPLHAALAALSVIQTVENGTASGEARDLLDRQLRQMSRLIEDILEASRVVRNLTPLNKTRTDVRAVVREALETTAFLQAERGHDVRISVPEHAIVLEADGSRLQQAVVNLLSNAARYTPAGGRIHVRVECGSGEVIIAVQDTGVGIAAEDLARIFDLFARGDGCTGKGLGIGLAVARKLVEQHGGRLEARSDGPGQGSEFIIRLPAPATLANAAPVMPLGTRAPGILADPCAASGEPGPEPLIRF